MTQTMEKYQTQCSHCQHIFMITQEQLTLKDGLARCGNCKQIFSAKDHLMPVISSAQDSHITPATPSTPNPISHPNDDVPTIDARELPTIIPAKPAKPTLSKDENFLFDDDSGLDIDTKPDSPTLHDHHPDFSLDILEDFDTLPSAYAKKQAPALDSIQTSENPSSGNNEEAWLEELLEKEAISEKNRSYLSSSHIEKPSHVSDVSSLLEEFGVEMAPEKVLELPEYQQRLNERFNHQPTAHQLAQKKPVTRQLLWAIGSLILLLGLFAQYAIFNQNSVVKNVGLAATLHSTCDSLKLPCHLPYADIKAINAKVLSFEGKETNSDIVISLTNRSTQSQVYPNLKFTLQSNNVGVAQFIATPDQYLEDASRALQPQQIKPIKLRVNFPRNKADQVAIDPFY